MKFELLILLTPLIFAFPKKTKSIAAAAIISLGGMVAAVASIIAIANGSCSIIPSLDRISGVFVLAISIVGTAASIYAVGFTKDMVSTKRSSQISLHFLCLAILFFSMIHVLIADTRYEFLLWWELMTLSSFLLVIFEGSKKQVLHAGISYLILMHLSFFFLLGAFSVNTGDMWSSSTMGIWLLFLVGFGLKSALFPMHIWLPVTYLNTPSHVTAMMSGVMINMGIYGIIRTTMTTPEPYIAGVILFCAGAFSGLFGIIKAVMHTGLKRLLAYSSVENMGIITMAIGLGTIGAAIDNATLEIYGYGGALLHTLNHSAYKSMLFMAAGAVEKETGISDLNRMGGLLKRMPLTGAVFAIGALAICAIPPLSGFFSEFTIFSGLFHVVADESAPIVGIAGIITLALIGGLSIMTFSKAFSMTFLGQPRCGSMNRAKEANKMILIAYTFPLTCIIIGGILFPFLVLPKGSPLQSIMLQIELAMGVATAIIVALWLLRRHLQKGKAIEIEPTWGCAFTAPNKNMQYTSSSMSRELQETITSSDKQQAVDITEIFPSAQSFSTRHTDRANRVITQTAQRFLRRWTARLALFQTGKTNQYILHALLFLILIFLLSFTGAI